MGRIYTKPALVEDLEWMLATGETWDGALARLGVSDNTAKRVLQRLNRTDLMFRLRRDWDGWALARAHRAAERPWRKLKARKARQKALARFAARRAATAERMARTRRMAERARQREERRRERERLLASVVCERFPGLVDVEALVAELVPRCGIPGCGREREPKRKTCPGHGARIKRFGHAFPEVPLAAGNGGGRALRRAVEERRRELATAEEEAS
jgi:hypothetical protein